MGRNRKIIASELAVQANVPRPHPFDKAFRQNLADVALSRKLPFLCDDKNWKQLERIFLQFYRARSIATQFPSKVDVDKYLSQVARVAKALSRILEQATDLNHMNMPLLQAGHEIEGALKSNWRFEMRPQGERAGYEWDLGDVAHLVHCLAEAARADQRPASGIVDVAPRDFGFVRFVDEMDDWWKEVTGTKASARKDETSQIAPTQSPFVQFMQILLRHLPGEYRPTIASTAGALATAISDARRSSRGNKQGDKKAYPPAIRGDHSR